jgi:rod shape-determining protein MreC
VLLINDQSSGVGVILDKSRLQGVIKGTAAGEVILEKVMTDEQVSPGDLIVTSGGDQIFPKGLTVGTVMKVSPSADLFLNIRVKPSANLSRLEEVLVITKKEDRAPSLAETNSVRAVDILTQRLPSVPDKPASDANQPTGTEPPAGATKPANGAPKPQGNAGLNTRAGDSAGPAGIKPAALQKPVPAAKRAAQTSRPAAAAPPPAEPAAREAGTAEDKPH